jgi:hypothetical protein
MVALKHLKSQAVSLQAFAPDVSSATAYVINKSLNKEPDQRYQNYDELIEHLEYAHTELLAKAAQPRQPSRLVLEGEQNQRAMGWITMAMIAVVVITGIVIFVVREREAAPNVNASAENARKANAALEPSYEAARQKLLAGQSAEAAEAFPGARAATKRAGARPAVGSQSMSAWLNCWPAGSPRRVQLSGIWKRAASFPAMQPTASWRSFLWILAASCPAARLSKPLSPRITIRAITKPSRSFFSP